MSGRTIEPPTQRELVDALQFFTTKFPAIRRLQFHASTVVSDQAGDRLELLCSAIDGSGAVGNLRRVRIRVELCEEGE